MIGPKEKKFGIFVNSRLYEVNGTGIPNYIKSLYSEIEKKDHMNSYTFLQTGRQKTLGVTKINGKSTYFGAVAFDLFQVVGLIPSNNEPVILHGASNILPLRKPKNAKFVVTIHDLAFLRYPQYQSKAFNIYYKFAVKRALKLADIVVAVSRNTMRDIVDLYHTPPEKIRVIYPGISQPFITSEKYKRLIPERYFLSICTHPKRKNIISVLDAMASNSNIQDLKYVIAGHMSQNHREELQEKIHSSGLDGRVIIYGYAEEGELVSLYQNAEFFIYPSFYEGFGFPVLEAMSLGCPVITSNNSSLTEITPDRKWLIDPLSIDDISEAMSRMAQLSSDERSRLIEANSMHAANFRWSTAATDMIELFDELKAA